jgi:hypothetical protein
LIPWRCAPKEPGHNRALRFGTVDENRSAIAYPHPLPPRSRRRSRVTGATRTPEPTRVATITGSRAASTDAQLELTEFGSSSARRTPSHRTWRTTRLWQRNCSRSSIKFGATARPRAREADAQGEVLRFRIDHPQQVVRCHRHCERSFEPCPRPAEASDAPKEDDAIARNLRFRIQGPSRRRGSVVSHFS